MKNLLLEAESEIKRLRHTNEILQAQVNVVEVFAHALGMRNHSHGMGEDVAWKLRRAADDLDKQPDADAPHLTDVTH